MSSAGRPADPGATALHASVTIERVGHELAQRIRRALPSELIVLARWQESGDPEIVSASAPLPADELRALVRSAAGSRPLEGVTWAGNTSGLTTIALPIAGETFLVVGFSADDAADRAPIEHTVETIARDAAIALDRVTEVDRLVERERIRGMERAAAGIAHELRNPLFAIASASQLLRHAVGDDPVVERNIGRIMREVDRLSSLMASLLDYGQPVPIRREPGDPDQVWTDVLSGARGSLEPRAILVDHRSASPRAHCAIDAEQLGHAFSHLLRHATHSAAAGTDISIASAIGSDRAWRCTIRFQLHDPAVLPPDVQPFAPGGAASREMGLAIANRILLAHDATLGVAGSASAEQILTISLAQA